MKTESFFFRFVTFFLIASQFDDQRSIFNRFWIKNTCFIVTWHVNVKQLSTNDMDHVYNLKRKLGTQKHGACHASCTN